MNSKGIEYRVGIFAIAGIVAILFAVYLLSPDLFDEEAKVVYYTSIDDATKVGSLIKLI